MWTSCEGPGMSGEMLVGAVDAYDRCDVGLMLDCELWTSNGGIADADGPRLRREGGESAEAACGAGHGRCEKEWRVLRPGKVRGAGTKL